MHMRPVGETVALHRAAGLEVRDVHALREHYARTVAAWRTTLRRAGPTSVALVGEEMARVWRLYLAGGALAFEENRMGVDQILAVKPDPSAGRDGATRNDLASVERLSPSVTFIDRPRPERGRRGSC